jgi:hypothetical protein
LHDNDTANGEDNDCRHIRRPSRDAAEARNATLQGIGTPGHPDPNGNEHQGEADAEGGDHDEPQDVSFLMQAGEEHREGRWAWQETARESKPRNLGICNRTTRQRLAKLGRMGSCVGVLV